MRVMCVGTATLDIVNRVTEYPAEDSEVRALAQSQRMGGNAANSAVVLAQLGARTFWVGNLTEQAEVVDQAFARYGVNASLAVRIKDGTMPTSYITISEASGSRSIVHFRDLPEYRATDFLEIDLGGFDWVHFEGRAIRELTQMLARTRATPGPGVSLEVEKSRAGIEALFRQADLLLFSRDYARAKGFDDAESLLRSLPGGLRATCTWGAQGAWAVERDGQLHHVAASPPEAVVDTVGAGDAFNAAMVRELGNGKSLQQALSAAVSLASATCGREGLTIVAS